MLTVVLVEVIVIYGDTIGMLFNTVASTRVLVTVFKLVFKGI